MKCTHFTIKYRALWKRPGSSISTRHLKSLPFYSTTTHSDKTECRSTDTNKLQKMTVVIRSEVLTAVWLWRVLSSGLQHCVLRTEPEVLQEQVRSYSLSPASAGLSLDLSLVAKMKRLCQAFSEPYCVLQPRWLYSSVQFSLHHIPHAGKHRGNT